MDHYTLLNDDCLAALKNVPNCSIDSIITDPPYGLRFMGKKWDHDVPCVELWEECLRVLKPGGHLLAFAGTRTQHRMAVNIEDAGFEIRDMIAWVYGSGFPKSLDVSKAIDKAAGAERERMAGPKSGGMASLNKGNASHGYRDSAYYKEGNMMLSSEPATPEAHQWQGWGTALKPALEPITVARKPLNGTVADNVLEYGTGALNIDGCRVETESGGRPLRVTSSLRDDIEYSGNSLSGRADGSLGTSLAVGSTDLGRWPANLIHDGSDDVMNLFPQTSSGVMKAGQQRKASKGKGGYCDGFPDEATSSDTYGDSGSAARFFYCAKASKKERGEDNNHPTVKPIELMKYLCRLVTPQKGVILDPFMGSGTTGVAARQEGFNFIGIEREPEYFNIAQSRIKEINVLPI